MIQDNILTSSGGILTNTLIHKTQALCPDCLQELEADVVEDQFGAVYLNRTCPKHGPISFKIWPNAEHYKWMSSFSMPKLKPQSQTPSKAPCPFSCGLCSRHERMSTLLEIEVTVKCNLRCPVCFMSAEDSSVDPDLDDIRKMYETIKSSVGTDGAVQLTGGEPSCREDLAEIIKLGRSMGFWGIEINTNGLRIAHEDGYLESLVQAGLTGVYLSFDGLDAHSYKSSCGVNLLPTKLKVIERCREVGIQCVLAVTVIKNINNKQLGDIVEFCLENIDVVAGLALQPAFISGRFEEAHSESYTMGDVIYDLAEQSQGLIDVQDIWPLGCAHPLCDSGTLLVKNEETEAFEPITRYLSKDDFIANFNQNAPQGSVFFDIASKKKIDISKSLSIIIMNYMDARTMDTQRLRECSMTVVCPDGAVVPFCSYHLTNSKGRRVYAPWNREDLRYLTERS